VRPRTRRGRATRRPARGAVPRQLMHCGETVRGKLKRPACNDILNSPASQHSCREG
jgi:hypothetical protein